jgi:hypothetical protein
VATIVFRVDVLRVEFEKTDGSLSPALDLVSHFEHTRELQNVDGFEAHAISCASGVLSTLNDPEFWESKERRQAKIFSDNFPRIRNEEQHKAPNTHLPIHERNDLLLSLGSLARHG